MPRWRLARGLFGTALTWGAVGALIGAGMFVARYRPWPVSAMHGERFFRLLGAFLGGAALWGAVCGVAFGVAVWRLGRRGSLEQVSTRRVMLWGALAGAAFPLLIYTPIVLRGAFGAIPFFATIAGVSAVAGAAVARAVFALARRAPAATEPAELVAASMSTADAMSFAMRERDV